MTQSEVSQVSSAIMQASTVVVNITYDKLFELLRAERNNPSLQQLPTTFFADVRSYLQLKQDSILKNRNSSDIFAAEHLETTQQQVKNAVRILADITDRRERKIMSLALNRARASASSVDVSNLLVEEKALFSQIVALLVAQRSTLNQLVTSPSSAVMAAVAAANSSEMLMPPTIEMKIEKSYLVVEDITEFFGPDMKHYGPFVKDDTAMFSDQIARILLKKNLVKLQ